MTEKFINIGVFWLPLIAGIILGGMAPSVWYGGDKSPARCEAPEVETD
jgi:hypothetical protein